MTQYIKDPAYIVVDLFCGAGGTTIGMEESGVAKVIAAVNHDPKAIKSHWINHPEVKHFEEDIRTLDLAELTEYVRRMRILYPHAKLILWASLECTNFSKAKGGLPREGDSRTLAYSLLRKWNPKKRCYYKRKSESYIQLLNPDEIWIENVVEFMSWGPLDENGKPLSKRNGVDFLAWKRAICKLGYIDDWRELDSADFGARTKRNRLFGQFVRPTETFVWPKPTHAKNPEKAGWFGTLEKHLPCRPCLDLDDYGTSIFTPGKISSDKTYERIYAGLIKFVAKMKKSEFISKYYSGDPMSKNISLDGPSATIKTIDNQALVQVEFILKYNSMSANGDMDHAVHSVDAPAPTIPAQRQPNLVGVDFIANYHGNGDNVRSLEDPAPTITAADINSIIHAQWLDRQFGNGTKYQSIDDPAGAVMPVPKMNLVQPEFIMDTQFNNVGQSTDDPLNTITANRKHFYLMNPQYMNAGGDLDKPCFTLIARMDKMPPYLIVTESGDVAIEIYTTDSDIVRRIKQFMAWYGIADIKMRMLKVIELKRLQGFPEDYQLLGNQADQKKFIGNSVVPHVVKSWVLAKYNRLMDRIMVA